MGAGGPPKPRGRFETATPGYGMLEPGADHGKLGQWLALAVVLKGNNLTETVGLRPHLVHQNRCAMDATSPWAKVAFDEDRGLWRTGPWGWARFLDPAHAGAAPPAKTWWRDGACMVLIGFSFSRAPAA